MMSLNCQVVLNQYHIRLCFSYRKKHKALPTNPAIHIYVNRINNRLVFKTKDGYKLELQTTETIKLFGFTKN